METAEAAITRRAAEAGAWVRRHAVHAAVAVARVKILVAVGSTAVRASLPRAPRRKRPVRPPG
ncbi:hypothetical protein OG738_38320 [Amycolatopsis sp. NBC_01488]|uniref:hypothetical protein n=1 Tax=Amycolatopsis sp. NBC_01488 TaxID=2903563 RepID=UPI002E29930A|nr:hypothetical protein [Amycolatopsis sp. NBC_01488]